MFVNKLLREIRLSGKWKSLYLKKHKVNKTREKLEKKYSKSVSNETSARLAYQYLENRYSKYLDSIIDKSLDVPMKGEPVKVIYWMWLQGEESAPSICKACLASIRKYLPDYEVIILTSENIYDYIDLPEYIKKKYEDKLITNTHFSDICRAALLTQKGGLWVDSTVLFTDRPKEYLDLPLFAFRDFSFLEGHPVVASSWLISSYKNHPILATTLKMLYKYWEDTSLLLDYFVFHYFFKMVTDRYQKLWKAVPNYPNKAPHVLQFELLDEYDENRLNQIKKMSPVHKLNWKLKRNENKKDFYQAICNQEIFK